MKQAIIQNNCPLQFFVWIADRMNYPLFGAICQPTGKRLEIFIFRLWLSTTGTFSFSKEQRSFFY
jgi:hypothetical protein